MAITYLDCVSSLMGNSFILKALQQASGDDGPEPTRIRAMISLVICCSLVAPLAAIQKDASRSSLVHDLAK